MHIEKEERVSTMYRLSPLGARKASSLQSTRSMVWRQKQLSFMIQNTTIVAFVWSVAAWFPKPWTLCCANGSLPNLLIKFHCIKYNQFYKTRPQWMSHSSESRSWMSLSPLKFNSSFSGSESNSRRLVDQNESRAVALLIENFKSTGSLTFYNSGICFCQVGSICICIYI